MGTGITIYWDILRTRWENVLEALSLAQGECPAVVPVVTLDLSNKAVSPSCSGNAGPVQTVLG